MKLYQIDGIYTILSKLQEEELPFALSYKIIKIIKRIDIDREYYINSLKDIAQKYAEKDEEGIPLFVNGNLKFPEGNLAEASAALTELENVDCAEDIPKFTIKELSVLNISPRDVATLFPIIEEEE